jgi:hypothetical protein
MSVVQLLIRNTSVFTLQFIHGLFGRTFEYKERNGIYLQTYGGETEGGYVITPEYDIYEVNRDGEQNFR